MSAFKNLTILIGNNICGEKQQTMQTVVYCEIIFFRWTFNIVFFL